MVGLIISGAVAVAAVLLAVVAVLVSRPLARRCRPLARRCGTVVDRCRTVMPPERLPPWFTNGVAASLLVLVAGAAVAAGLVAVFVEILDGVAENDDLTVIDRPVVEWIAARRIGGASPFVVAVTDIGSKILLGLFLTVAATAVAVRLRAWQPIVLATVAGGGGALLVAGVKGLIGRDRPDLPYRVIAEDGFSFPSGHSASVLVVLGTVAWLISMVTRGRMVRATAWVAAGLLTVAVGASRVYLGVHYPSDVLGGWVLGATWLVTVAVAARLPHPWLLAVADRWPVTGERRWHSWRRHPVALFTATAITGLAAIFGIVAMEAMTG